jgi:hypothetical protein
VGFWKKDQTDRELINLDQRWELGLWTRMFGVTEEELRAAIVAVGPDAENVRRYFRFPQSRQDKSR